MIVPDRFSEDRRSSHIPRTKTPFLLTSSEKFLRGPLMWPTQLYARTPPPSPPPGDDSISNFKCRKLRYCCVHLNHPSGPWAALAANRFILCRLWNVNNVQKGFDSIIGSSELESRLHLPPPRSEPTSFFYPPPLIPEAISLAHFLFALPPSGRAADTLV